MMKQAREREKKKQESNKTEMNREKQRRKRFLTVNLVESDKHMEGLWGSEDAEAKTGNPSTKILSILRQNHLLEGQVHAVICAEPKAAVGETCGQGTGYFLMEGCIRISQIRGARA